MHWALAGVGIGFVTLVLLFTTGHRLGISSGFEDLCSLVYRAPYLKRAELVSARRWRLPFLLGLLVAGAASSALAHHGTLTVTWDLGRFDTTFGWGPMAKAAFMFLGGIFIGFGTRLAGGCTSGHGIFGISNFERASVTSTLSFMASGMVTTALIYGALAP